MAKKHDEFYADLDNQRQKPSLTCGGLIMMLALFAVLGSVTVYLLVSQIRKTIELNRPEISQIALDGAEQKLQSFLNIEQNKTQEIEVTFTDEELSSLLVKNEIMAQNDNFSLHSPSAQITPNDIVITTTLTKPLKAQVTAHSVPYVEDGQLKLRVTSMKAGALSVPSFLQSGISSLLDRLVNDRLNNDNVEYTEVILSSHMMTLAGKAKTN